MQADAGQNVLQGPAFGDVMAGMATAGAVAAALYKAKATGEGSVVDVSLLATEMWQASPLVVALMESAPHAAAVSSVL